MVHWAKNGTRWTVGSECMISLWLGVHIPENGSNKNGMNKRESGVPDPRSER